MWSSQRSQNNSTRSSPKTAAWYAAELLRQANDDHPVFLIFLQSKVFPPYDDRDVGLASKSDAKALAKATGHPEDDVVNAWKDEGDLGLIAERLTADRNQQTLFSNSYTVRDVYETFVDIVEAAHYPYRASIGAASVALSVFTNSEAGHKADLITQALQQNYKTVAGLAQYPTSR